VRRAVIAFALAIGLTGGAAAQQHEGGGLDAANNNISNTASLQRGAKYFVNYCLGCHSAKYVRYNRLGEDLQISDQQVIDNLMFTGERPFDLMSNAMRPEDSERWFGVSPPDLSLIARSRGTDYIYTFLRSFYAAPDRPTGANNTVLPGTAMPHVLWPLQGIQRAVFTTDEHGVEVFDHFELVQPGALDSRAFDDAVRDIVNFLDYIGEPIKKQRQQLGTRVIGFLLVFLLIAFMLKKEIWKDVK
jgi:ubiquinol-cytochrome c reductase cytochrome c1 subunit